ncbi:MAG TPA: CBS domain-containing protein [Gammaproteobacteria bacterium]
MTLHAEDIMTRDVATVAESTPVEDIARLLLERRISAVPVVTAGGEVVGIVSEGDLMRRPEIQTEKQPSWWLSLLLTDTDRAARYIKSHGRTAKDVMSTPVVTIDPQASLAEIAELLEKRQIKRVPVLRDGVLVGIVSRANLLRGLATHRPTQPQPVDRTSDQLIRDQLLETLRKEAGVRHEFVNVVVSGGTVHLWGSVFSETERRAVRVAAENTAGVRRIEDNLHVLPPNRLSLS